MLSANGAHRFAHLGSHCDVRTAHMFILYAAVEFELHANAEYLHSSCGLPDYYTCVQIMDQAGQVPKSALLDAHRILAMIVTENFWRTIVDLAPNNLLVAPSVADMISRPRYVLRLDDTNTVSVDGPVKANPYCVQPLSLVDIPTCREIATIHSRELVFVDHAQESASLAGIVKFPNGHTAWFKPAEELKVEHFLTELEIYQRITAKSEAATIRARIPTLHALAITQDSQSVLGILITSITGKMLSDCSQTARELHQTQWQQQVNESLRFLHSCGVTWGDVNETNIMIDEKDEAWIIDFEGGQIEPDSTVLNIEAMEKDLKDVETIFTQRKRS